MFEVMVARLGQLEDGTAGMLQGWIDQASCFTLCRDNAAVFVDRWQAEQAGRNWLARCGQSDAGFVVRCG